MAARSALAATKTKAEMKSLSPVQGRQPKQRLKSDPKLSNILGGQKERGFQGR